jgi:predicted enzyme related to lactoylglutathione lyase
LGSLGGKSVISGVHAVIHTKDPKGVRIFFRDVLKFRSVDAGDGWLIFALPPAELGIHPTKRKGSHEIYLMCRDVKKTVVALKKKGVKFAGAITDVGWGLITSIMLPGGDTLGLYQSKHRSPLRNPR